MDNKVLTLWSCEPSVGRRTLADRLADQWADRDQRVMMVSFDAPEANPSMPTALQQLSHWVPRFKTLPPEMLRNFLSKDDDLVSRMSLTEWPESTSLIKDFITLLRQSYTWTLILSPVSYDDAGLAALDASDALLWISKPGKSGLNLYNEGIQRLAALHFSNAFSHVIQTQSTGPAPSRGAMLDVLPRDVAPWLRFNEAVRRLSHTLETQPALYKAVEKSSRPEEAQKFVDDLKSRVQPQMLKALEKAPTGIDSETPLSEAVVAQQTLEACLAEEGQLTSREERHDIYVRVLDEVLGLGPLEPLIKDPTITEIMVNGQNTIYVERKGKLYATDARFSSNTQLRTVIDRIVAPIGRRVDESMPICDARLADGSRVNIVLPPLALDGATITIRKFSARAFGFPELIGFGSITKSMADFLVGCVRLRKNMIISGGTGSGKTTLLNALSSAIPDDERIVTIEDAAELRLQKPHIVRLESRPANAEGEGAIPIRRLVINALRMRPDRIVVGECRGGEALDMLQAMNTGHDGSLTTIHANTPRDALGRLETLVLMAGMDLPLRVVREQIRSAVHFIIQQARMPDGSRKVVSITELMGLEGDTLVTQEIYRHHDGQFEATGIVSDVTREWAKHQAVR